MSGGGLKVLTLVIIKNGCRTRLWGVRMRVVRHGGCNGFGLTLLSCVEVGPVQGGDPLIPPIILVIIKILIIIIDSLKKGSKEPLKRLKQASIKAMSLKKG